MTLRFGPLKRLKPLFFLGTNYLFLERNNVSDMNIFDFSHEDYTTQTLSQSYQRSEDFDTIWKCYYYLKENACKMIWWRPRIKIHIPAARMSSKNNSLKRSLVCQHKIKFLIHTL